MILTNREVELLHGMLEVQSYHAIRASNMETPMGDKQYHWDMERVDLLNKILKESTVEES